MVASEAANAVCDRATTVILVKFGRSVNESRTSAAKDKEREMARPKKDVCEPRWKKASVDGKSGNEKGGFWYVFRVGRRHLLTKVRGTDDESACNCPGP